MYYPSTPLAVENLTLTPLSPHLRDKLSLPTRPKVTVQQRSATLHILDATEATDPFYAPF